MNKEDRMLETSVKHCKINKNILNMSLNFYTYELWMVGNESPLVVVRRTGLP